jgi:hypothetical protein
MSFALGTIVGQSCQIVKGVLSSVSVMQPFNSALRGREGQV